MVNKLGDDTFTGGARLTPVITNLFIVTGS